MLDFLKGVVRRPPDALSDTQHVASWLRSLPEDESTRLREIATRVRQFAEGGGGVGLSTVEALFQACDAGIEAHHRAGYRYIYAGRLDPAEEKTLRPLILSYGQSFLAAWLRVLDAAPVDVHGAILARVIAQAMHFLNEQARWEYYRHQQPDAQFWPRLHALWRHAERAGVTREPCTPFAGGHETTVEHAYLSALMLSLLAGGNLATRSLEVARQLLNRLSLEMQIGRDPEGASFMVRLDSDWPVLRPRTDGVEEGEVRYWSTRAVCERLGQWQAMIADGAVPLPLSGMMDALQREPQLLAALLREWSPVRRQYRRAERQPMDGPVDVVSRLAVIHRILRAPGAGEDEGGVVHRWNVRDRSDCGVGMALEGPGNNWVALGRLLAYRFGPGEPWQLGMVRRIRREAMYRMQVGVERFARLARPVSLSRPESPEWLSSVPAELQWADGLIALQLPWQQGGVRMEAVLLPLAWYEPDTDYLLRDEEAAGVVRLGRLIEQENELGLAELVAR